LFLAADEEQDELTEAVLAAPEGDLRAFETLVKEHQRWIVADCRAITRDESVSEDLAQEVLLKAYFGLKNFEGRSSMKHWLRTIKVNHCLNHIKKQKGKNAVSIDDEGPQTKEEVKAFSETDRSYDRLDEQQIIERILKDMPDGLRIPLVLRDMDELSYEEVAAALNLQLSATKMRIKRAREWFRERYAAYAARPGQEAAS
jgi:RNA polymerase sigma-70 factor (ECF subfamily)